MTACEVEVEVGGGEEVSANIFCGQVVSISMKYVSQKQHQILANSWRCLVDKMG